ncbi:hypothetical protein VTN77DRAFT_3014 [Rasamsonia byssochlamydoides]|uniref:uncharacterized protein n=1 Tax=Rasamsonia byssochlamydoides TaxID=89139 RepID=UPI00374294A8
MFNLPVDHGRMVLPADAGAAFRRSLEEVASHACWAEQTIGGRILPCPGCAVPPSSSSPAIQSAMPSSFIQSVIDPPNW